MGFYLCPSCHQKRTLLFGEQLAQDVFLRLPHRQFVFAIPKCLRPYFMHNRTLFSAISRLIFNLIQDYYNEVAGREITSGLVLSHQTFGDFAGNLLSWKNSGFSIDNSVRISSSDKKARESLAQYIARAPVSLEKIRYEPFHGKVLFKTPKYNDYFKENFKSLDVLDFIALVTAHIPPKHKQYIRRYGLYSSRSRGKWREHEHLCRLAPDMQACS